MWRINSTLSQPAFRHANPTGIFSRYVGKWIWWAAFLGCILPTLLSSSSALAARGSPLEDLKGPDVTIIAGEERTVYEFRQNGVLRMVKIVPKWGKPYYLVPRDATTGFGDLERADMLLPSWVIFEF